MSTDDHPDSGLPLHAQIANTEFRLAALRQKRETFLRQGRMMKRVAWVAVGLAPLPVIYAAVTSEPDPIPMVFIASLLIAAAAVLLWMYRHSTWISDPGPNNGMAYNRYTSYWVYIEESIQQNEQRLGLLKSRSDSGGDPHPAP